MPANPFNGYTNYDIGIGLRVPHYRHILAKKPVVDWFEIISENFIVYGGRPLEVPNTNDLRAIPSNFEIARHAADQIRAPRDFLEGPIYVENVSSYAEYHA